MSDHTCINCGSSNITQLKDSDFITSQPIVQELITLKRQKEKQFKTDTKDFHTFDLKKISKIHEKVNKKIRESKNIEEKEKWISLHLVLVVIWVLLFPIFIVLLILFSIIFLNPISVFFIELTKSFFNDIRKNKKRLNHKSYLSKINKQLYKCFSLFYCYDCDSVMDLEEKRYEKSENTNKLIKQILEI